MLDGEDAWPRVVLRISGRVPDGGFERLQSFVTLS